eukprot:TRINITY_DN9933_c1_g2_i4.p1 TRINITY_DN9933_c1_g2~~TRINITY_DN9933_c1_g2_i4.p1  ORF type:complete len:382 (-),score=86.41 TRINITY_DN9933_c1_g2_i4:133-1278(-)
MASLTEEAQLPTHVVSAPVLQLMSKVKLKSQTLAKSTLSSEVENAFSVDDDRPTKRSKVAEQAVRKDQRPNEFTVNLDLTKVSTGLGLEVDWADGKTLFIKGVKGEGAVPTWNKSNPSRSILAGDRVISINDSGAVGKAMLAICKKKKKLALLIQSGKGESATQEKNSNFTDATSNSNKQVVPASAATATPALPPTTERKSEESAPKHFEFNVTLDFSSGQNSLGLDVDWADGKCLYIRQVLSGAVEDWNRHRASHLSVHPGDRIMAVNGFADDGLAMSELCKELISSRNLMQLRVRGPPPPPEANGKGNKEDKKEKKEKKEKDRDREKKEKKEKDRDREKKEKDGDGDSSDRDSSDREKEKTKKKDKDKDKEKRRRSSNE